jgi:peptide deformylase
MAIRNILTYPHPLLAQKAKPVTEVTPEIQKLIDDMAETMYFAPGVGLAAPQVGELVRIVVIDVDYTEEGKKPKLHAMINPEIVSRSGDIMWEEGCLSVPGVNEDVKRAATVTVRFLDYHGKPQELTAEGLFAVCIQHELDHLEGTLFVDRLSSFKKKLALRDLNTPDYPYTPAPTRGARP